jgi:N-carbamoyl-L-amino-acid hydrolase
MLKHIMNRGETIVLNKENCHEWVAEILGGINQFGRGEQGKGITRLAYSDADNAASNYIIEQMKKAGMTVNIDKMGNIIGRLAGTDDNAPIVACGSHLDTVPQGGEYDGVVGVVAGLAAMINLKNKGSLTHPLELIIFRAEESSRFGAGTLGSKIMAEKVSLDSLSKAKDQQGISFADALALWGYSFQELDKVVRKPDEFKAFVEVHIEQGRVLEEEKLTVGVVEAIAAPTRLKVKVRGFADHSGATPMHQRKDALTAASEMILAVEKIATENSSKGMVGTVGVLTLEPGAMNVVPGLVTFWVDIRGVDYEVITNTWQDFKDEAVEIAKARGVEIEIDVLGSERPVVLADEVISVIENECKKLGLSYRKMNSGAGHDAMNMAAIANTGMIFIPCRKGISHNPEEYASIEDICTSIDVLTETMYQLAK